VTAAEALANPDLINRVAGNAPASPTTVRKFLSGEAPGRVKAAFARISAALAKEGVTLAPAPPRLASVPPAKEGAL
jgi:hypothetical protein